MVIMLRSISSDVEWNTEDFPLEQTTSDWYSKKPRRVYSTLRMSNLAHVCESRASLLQDVSYFPVDLHAVEEDDSDYEPLSDSDASWEDANEQAELPNTMWRVPCCH